MSLVEVLNLIDCRHCSRRSADFGSAEARAGGQAGAMRNSVERFVDKGDGSFEDAIDTSHNAQGSPWSRL